MSKHPFDEYVERLNKVLEGVGRAELDRTADALMACHSSNGAIYIIGNGGSASTATHMACDLSKGPTPKGGQGLVVWSLTDNPALLTAIGNDLSYDLIFSEVVRQRMKSQDILIAISASGNSPNILDAVKTAQKIGCTTIGMTGFSGGLLAKECDIVLHADGQAYGPVEDVHLICNHYLVEALKIRLSDFASKQPQEQVF
jgi:D-sedoheptulose 7-phosphate isomerase